MDNKLPGGQMLISGEEIISTDDFMSSIATFYIKSSFAITNKRVVTHFPKIVLGFLPFGANDITFNIKQISGVQQEVKYKISRFLIGFLVIIFGMGSGSFLGFLMGLLVGALIIGSGIQMFIKFATNGGIIATPIIFLEKKKATIFINKLNSAIAEHN